MTDRQGRRNNKTGFPLKHLIMTLCLFSIVFTMLAYISLDSKKAIHAASYLRINSGMRHDNFQNKVTVIIRSHDKYAVALIALLWSLEASQLPDHVGILALILPTEFNALAALKLALDRNWYANPSKVDSSSLEPNFRRVTVRVLEYPNTTYQINSGTLRALCTEEWRRRKLSENWAEKALIRYCSIDSPRHYALTDMALREAPVACPSCVALLVTNADNSYAPTFLSKTLQRLSGSPLASDPAPDPALPAAVDAGSPGFDVVMTDMLHLQRAVNVEPENSKMDLGCALLSMSFLRAKHISFLGSLPSPVEPQHFHDADYWLVHAVLQAGGRLDIVREVLFNHY